MDTVALFETAKVMRGILQDNEREYLYEYVSNPSVRLDSYNGTPNIEIGVDDNKYELITVVGEDSNELWLDFYNKFKTKEQRSRDNLIEKLVALETASEKVEGFIAENMLADILKPLKEIKKLLSLV